MNNVILVRFGEVFLKGKNRGWFEGLIIKNMKTALEGLNCSLKNIFGRYIISDYSNESENEIINRLNKVFGLHSLSKAVEIDTDEKQILNHLKTINLNNKSFKVATNRADKTFALTSMQFNMLAGGAVLETNNTRVDLHAPEITINIDIRENKKTYIFFDAVLLRGGLPVGSSGRCLVLLSGGIDSPVAAYMMARRGMNIGFLHFHSYPYTSNQAREKVLSLAKIVEGFCGKTKTYIANIKTLQEEINKNCNNSYMITIMRRVMMTVAKEIAQKHGFDCIATGESLGQVASQTIESLTATDLMSGNMPVLRPLIALDKTEIIKIAEDIGTFKTSILPYEDCCTVFLPKSPIIKPVLKNIETEESKINLNKIVSDILGDIEIVC